MATLRWLSGDVVAEGLPGAAAAREAAEAHPLAFGMLVGLSDDREAYPADLEVTALLKLDPAALLFARAAGLTLAGLRDAATLHAVTEEPRLALPQLRSYSVVPQNTWPGVLRMPALERLRLLPGRLRELGDLREALPRLRALTADHNFLEALPPLPATLLRLDVTGNRLARLELVACEELRDVKAANNRLSAVSLGPAVETLDVRFNRLHELRGPPGLRQLDASDNLLGGVLDLEACASLVELRVARNFLEEVRVAPGATLVCANVGGNAGLARAPAARQLSVAGTSVALSDSTDAEVLDASGVRLPSVWWFQSAPQLRVLHLEGCRLQELLDLPPGLDELAVSDNWLRCLWPRGPLRVLRAARNLLTRLEGPWLTGVVELDVAGNLFRALPQMPGLQRLVVDDCQQLRRLPELSAGAWVSALNCPAQTRR